MVHGNHLYFFRIDRSQGPETDGADIPSDVSDLWDGSLAGAYCERYRSMAGRRTADEKGSVLETWDRRYGADLLCRICDRKLSKS